MRDYDYFDCFNFQYSRICSKTKTINHKKTHSGELHDDIRSNEGNFSVDDSEIFILVNAERVRHGLNRLFWDEDLADIALDYSKKMADEDFSVISIRTDKASSSAQKRQN